MKNLIYTFRSYPHTSALQSAFIFGPLNQDFERLKDEIYARKPKYIIGIARTTDCSRIEPVTVNKFGKQKKIIVGGPDSYNLFLPSQDKFKTSDRFTTSFCNWTMYRISNFIEINKINSKVVFIHLNDTDLPLLNDFIENSLT